MGLSELCIRRPVFTTLVTATIIVFGIFAYRLLGVAALPAVDFPTIQITAQLPGASAETMAASVASPIERQLSTISGITSLTSTSSLGRSQIIVQFDLNRNIDSAALDVQTALTVAARRLPIEMTTPPSFRKVNPGDFAVMVISVNSQTLPLSKVNEFAETQMAPQISQLPGVAQVEVYGSQKFAIRVQVDPVAAAARNISLDEIRRVIASTNSNSPVGTLYGPRQNVTLSATAAMRTADEYKQVIVAYRNGAPVRLHEIADVIESVENNRQATWFNENRAVMLGVLRQPGSNAVAVVDAVRERHAALRGRGAGLGQSQVLNDRSISVRESVEDVQITLGIAVALVVLVIFLFLRSARRRIIPTLAVPVSLIGTAAAMYALGFSINNMTLLALTLSVGFVVDDAIVMLENIVRHVENGMRPFEAALKGAKEIGFTIISITFSLIAVFIPVLLMGGMVGRIFREFAVTISVAIIISGFVSLTLTPMLCARMLRHQPEGEKQNFVLRAFEAMFKSWLRAYEWSLDRVISFKAVMLLITIGTLFGTVWLYIIIPKGFFPSEDTGFMFVSTQSPADMSFQSLVRHAGQGGGDHSQGSRGPVSQFDDRSRRPVRRPRTSAASSLRSSPATSADGVNTVIDRLRAATANAVPGLVVRFRAVQNLNISGRPSQGEYQYTLTSSDTDTLYRVAPEIQAKIAELGIVRDVSTDLDLRNPQMNIEIDREKAAVYGISIEQVRQELFNAFGSRQVATIYTPDDDYQVILESKPEFQTDISALSRIYLKTASGQAVPLEAVTRLTSTVGPLQVNHQGNQPSVTISFNLAPGASLGQAVDAIQQIERDARLPATVISSFQGSRAGVPGVAEGTVDPGAGGDLRRLCAARHPLRELHPSDHHHLRPAVGRHRRADHADGVQDGPLGHRHDRHRDARRHREKERDHDDRLRDRAATGSGSTPRRRSARRRCCASGRS